MPVKVGIAFFKMHVDVFYFSPKIPDGYHNNFENNKHNNFYAM
jgi:hypothetical protein